LKQTWRYFLTNDSFNGLKQLS